jgi:hypothetical protein
MKTIKSGEQKEIDRKFSFQTIEEIIASAEAERTRIEAMIDIEKGWITLLPTPTHPYHIELSRIPDPLGLLEWINHLAGKGWMSRELIREFIRAVSEEKGWNLYRHL